MISHTSKVEVNKSTEQEEQDRHMHLRLMKHGFIIVQSKNLNQSFFTFNWSFNNRNNSLFSPCKHLEWVGLIISTENISVFSMLQKCSSSTTSSDLTNYKLSLMWDEKSKCMMLSKDGLKIKSFIRLLCFHKCVQKWFDS